MKFAGKDILSTEGVKLSGAVVCSATVNGSTLWRHPDQPGAEGATYEFLVWISKVKGQRRYYASILYLPETDAKGFLFGAVSFYSQYGIIRKSYILLCLKRYLSAQQIFRSSANKPVRHTAVSIFTSDSNPFHFETLSLRIAQHSATRHQNDICRQKSVAAKNKKGIEYHVDFYQSSSEYNRQLCLGCTVDGTDYRRRTAFDHPARFAPDS